MGKGDKKSKKGKIVLGTYGNSRKKKAIKARMKRAASRPSSSAEAAAKKTKRTSRKKAEA